MARLDPLAPFDARSPVHPHAGLFLARLVFSSR